MVQYNDKYYFRACSYYRHNGKLEETDTPAILKKAEALREHHKQQIRKRDGLEEIKEN